MKKYLRWLRLWAHFIFAAQKNTSGTQLTGKAASDVWAGAQTIWIKTG